MLNIEAANKLIADSFTISQRTVPILQSLGKILAEDVYVKRDLPPFNRVAMDGIAINYLESKEYLKTNPFNIEGIQGAGEPQKTLSDPKAGCLEVMTGAVLPMNCDLVIPYEWIKIEAKMAFITEEGIDLNPMLNIHIKGSDLKQGELALSKGQFINSSVIGIIASEGMPFVKVSSAPRIAIISTGDELVQIDKEPEDHQIYMSNQYTLKAELESFGHKTIETYHIADDEKVLFNELEKILEINDLILITGGVSKGKFDYVPKVLSDLSVKKVFHKVTQRPGKPLWFGKGEKGQLVFGLPGNPVSALVNLRRHVIPYLTNEHRIKVRLKEEVVFDKALTYFQQVKIEFEEGEFRAKPIKGNGSGDYYSLKDSSGFIELAKDQNTFGTNESYDYYPWGKTCL